MPNDELPFEDDDFPFEEFDSYEDLVRGIMKRADDFEAVDITVAARTGFVHPSGESATHNRSGAMVRLINGHRMMISCDDMERLINDGILSRHRIPIRLIPEGAEE